MTTDERLTLFIFSEIWNLDELYRETYKDYVSRGYKDVRATTANGDTENEEPSTKKQKVGNEDEAWENIVFLRTNFNDSELRSGS